MLPIVSVASLIMSGFINYLISKHFNEELIRRLPGIVQEVLRKEKINSVPQAINKVTRYISEGIDPKIAGKLNSEYANYTDSLFEIKYAFQKIGSEERDFLFTHGDRNSFFITLSNKAPFGYLIEVEVGSDYDIFFHPYWSFSRINKISRSHYLESGKSHKFAFDLDSEELWNKFTSYDARNRNWHRSILRIHVVLSRDNVIILKREYEKEFIICPITHSEIKNEQVKEGWMRILGKENLFYKNTIELNKGDIKGNDFS